MKKVLIYIGSAVLGSVLTLSIVYVFGGSIPSISDKVIANSPSEFVQQTD